MAAAILATKLYIPPLRTKIVHRPRLIERLNAGLSLGCKLTLVSASAGFSKTTSICEWIVDADRPAAWLSLDEKDNDPACFLTYLVAALQTIAPAVGAGAADVLQSTQPPSSESILTTLLNEIASVHDKLILVLDDYHVIEAKAVNQAVVFLLEHLPPTIHVVIATREDPPLPLPRLRAQGKLTELRAADLRFTPTEAAEFLNEVMGLDLAEGDIAALDARTEGWIAGLQLAAISMRGYPDTTDFIRSFTGSHHYVMDYLIEEVLQQQPERIQAFLLRTSVLDRLCGPLCGALLGCPPASAQEILEHLERANLFIVPLDDERRWYRYHHLFAELLRQQLRKSASSAGAEGSVADYHVRASQWYEENGLEIDAFQHAAAANDIDRAERLIQAPGLPLHFRGAVTAMTDWLLSLPKSVLDARPALSVRYATLSLVAGQSTGVEERLKAAETALSTALQGGEQDGRTRDLIGQIAAARATLALTRYDPEGMITQAGRALEYLHPDNMLSRIRATWTLGYAHQVRGDRPAAARAYTEAIAASTASGTVRFTIIATISLGMIEACDNDLHRAVDTFQRGLELAGDHLQPFENEAHLGLARIYYQWNDLDAAERHGKQSLKLARQFDSTIDRYIYCQLFLARLLLARGDVAGAASMVAESEESVRRNNFAQRAGDVADAKVLLLLRQGDRAAAARLAQAHELPLSRARVRLAEGNPAAALALLAPLRREMEKRGWADERLKATVLEVVALDAHGEREKARHLLEEALALAEPGGFVRLFVDEGEPMRVALSDLRFSFQKRSRGQPQRLVDYVDRLMAAFAQTASAAESTTASSSSRMAEPLSRRELEVLGLIAEGLSNQEIGDRLYLALDTIKGHNRRIFEKLDVKQRTEAVARGRQLRLL